jgi:hypothetical protein
LEVKADMGIDMSRDCATRRLQRAGDGHRRGFRKTADDARTCLRHPLHPMKMTDRITLHQHLAKCRKKSVIENAISSLGKMIVLDCIIANEDRHLGNFGFIVTR